MRLALQDRGGQNRPELRMARHLGQGRQISLWLVHCVFAWVGVTLLLGWGAGIDALVRVHPDWPAMVPTTCLLFLLAGGGLLHHLLTGRRWGLLACGLGLIAATSSVSHAMLPRYWSDMSDGISIATRFEFFLAGLGCTVLATSRRETPLWLVVPSTLGLMIVNVALIGFVFFHANFMSFNPFLAKLGFGTAVCFLLLHIAILFAAPQPIWTHLLLGRSPGAKLVRILLPCALAGPIVLGELAYFAAQSGQLDVQMCISLLVVASGWFLLVAIFFVARWINKASAQEKAALQQMTAQERAVSNAEAIAARVHKASSLGRVAGGVSHEFNNLLSVIQGNLELLREQPCIRETQNVEFLDAAMDATRRGAALTHQTLVLWGKIGARPGRHGAGPEDCELGKCAAQVPVGASRSGGDSGGGATPYPCRPGAIGAGAVQSGVQCCRGY